jgi:hypothetical protein
MMGRLKIPGHTLLGCLLLLGLVAAAHPAAAITGEEAAAKIEADYGVQALRVRAGTVDGVKVWLVTVMKPGGDSNDAFQVTTLALDQATGALVPAYRHGVHGPARPPDAFGRQIEQRPDVFRTGNPWR